MKFLITYFLFLICTYTWLYLDTRYYSKKKPSFTEKEIRDRITAAEYKIEKREYSDFRELDILLDIKDYWERELEKLYKLES